MNSKAENRKWLIVAGGFLFFFMTMGLYSNCFSLYIIPITEDLGFTRGQFSIAQTMIFISGIICSLTAPRLYRKLGLINVVRVAAVVGSACYIIESGATQLWQFYLLSFLEGMCMNLTCSMPMAILIGEWFRSGANTAIGITAVGSGIGGGLLNVIVNSVITGYGWRTAFRVMGIAALIINCIPAFILLKRNPEALAAEKEQKAAPEAKKARNPVDPRAYRFGAVSMAMNFTGCVIMYVAVPYLRDIGYSPAFTALVSSGSMIVLAVGKFIYGILLDRIGIQKCFMISQICGVIGLLGMTFFFNPIMLVPVYLACCLTCAYGSVGIRAVASYFSRGDNLSETMGAIMAIGSVGGALSTTVAGYVRDIFGSYVPVFAVLAVIVTLLVPVAQRMFNKA